jgi:hypothetical protein
MLNIFKPLRRHPRWSTQERRMHSRHACRIKVYYLAHGSWYRGSIQNISEGGLYIRSIQRVKFSKGEAILMIVDLRVLRDQIRGEIIRTGSNGLGIAFHTLEPEYSELRALLAAHCLF